MDKIGDYIPLIIIAISFIYSLAKKAGKAAKEAEKTTPPNRVPQREVFAPQSVWPLPEKDTKSNVSLDREKEKKSKSFLENYSRGSLEDMPDHVFRAEMARKYEEQSEKQDLSESVAEPVVFDFTSSDELKKGIIYAEIFNRKY